MHHIAIYSVRLVCYSLDDIGIAACGCVFWIPVHLCKNCVTSKKKIMEEFEIKEGEPFTTTSRGNEMGDLVTENSEARENSWGNPDLDNSEFNEFLKVRNSDRMKA